MNIHFEVRDILKILWKKKEKLLLTSNFTIVLSVVSITVSRSVSLSFKNEMMFYRISELMLSTLIQEYNKNHFILIQFKNERLTEISQLSDATLYDVLIPYINLSNLSWIKNVYF